MKKLSCSNFHPWYYHDSYGFRPYPDRVFPKHYQKEIQELARIQKALHKCSTRPKYVNKTAFTAAECDCHIICMHKTIRTKYTPRRIVNIGPLTQITKRREIRTYSNGTIS